MTNILLKICLVGFLWSISASATDCNHQLAVLNSVSRAEMNDLLRDANTVVPAFHDRKENEVSFFDGLASLSPRLQFYPEAYDFDRLQGHSRISWGRLNLRGFETLVLRVDPLVPSQKLVIFSHGYLDHVGKYTKFFDELVRNGYSVVAFDLPGHGLSSGVRASIGDFSTYGQMIGDLYNRYQAEFQEVVVMGFSTGSAAVIEARHHGEIPASARVVLIGPFIHINYYQIAEPAIDIGYHHLKFIEPVRNLPAHVAKVSGDEDFLNLLRADQLTPQTIPIEWNWAYVQYARETMAWIQHSTAEEKASFGETLILEGTADDIVAATANTNALVKAFPNSQMVWVKHGRHHLLNESSDILPSVYGPILQFMR